MAPRENERIPAALSHVGPTLKGRVWQLYGKRYDLTDFAHPGGALALLLGADSQDCTVLFESYHGTTAAAARARKFLSGMKPISGCHIAAPQCDVDAAAFHTELLDAVSKLPSTKTSRTMMACIALLLAVDIACWAGWLRGSTVALFLLPIAHWLLCCNVSHDAAHFALSSSPTLNSWAALLSAPLFFNTTFWYIQHNVSHHVHTNEVGEDMDLHHMAPFVRTHSSDSWLPIHALQFGFTAFGTSLSTIVQSLAFPMGLMLGIGNTAAKYGKTLVVQHTRWGMRLQVLSVLFVLSYPFFQWGFSRQAAAFAIYPFLSAGAIFMLFTQVSHIQGIVQHAPLKVWRHWSHQMVDSSVDYCQSSAVWTFLSGGLNMQGLHHCVPSLSSSRYRELYPAYRALCAKHGLVIHESPTLYHAALGYWSHIRALAYENQSADAGSEPVMVKEAITAVKGQGK